MLICLRTMEVDQFDENVCNGSSSKIIVGWFLVLDKYASRCVQLNVMPFYSQVWQAWLIWTSLELVLQILEQTICEVRHSTFLTFLSKGKCFLWCWVHSCTAIDCRAEKFVWKNYWSFLHVQSWCHNCITKIRMLKFNI